MTNDNLPPGLEGLLGEMAPQPDVPEGHRRCARCAEIKPLAMFPDEKGAPRHLCYRCLGGNTQAMNLPRARVRDGNAICPGCGGEFEVGPETYGEMAQCTDCDTVFIIATPKA